jgi:hypothetical protein
MLTGRPPFKGTSALDTLTQVNEQEPVPPRRLQPRVPRDLDTINLKCLEKEPRKRYATAAALAEDLRRFSAGEPITARPVNGWEQAVKWCRRRLALAGSFAAVVLVTLLGLAGVISQMLRAENALAEAVREKGVAETERARALRSAEAAEWQAYRANIAGASSAFQLHNIVSARRHLRAAPKAYRNWEWHYLSSQLDLSQSVLQGHADPALAVAFSPDGKRLVSCSADRTIRIWDTLPAPTHSRFWK